MSSLNKTTFAPELYIPRNTRKVDFYQRAFGAEELRRWNNDDGSIHVIELSIDGAVFHLHEETKDAALFSPEKYKGTTVLIGLFVPDVDLFVARAKNNGANIVSPPQSYDYGYRQAVIEDPFGHRWMIEQKI